MAHRIVVALGGNALQTSNTDTAEAQKQIAIATARQLVGLVASGHEIVITHGNGPQVGKILLNEETGVGGTPSHLDTCSAMSQGEIGYWLQQALYNELRARHVQRGVATIVTQTVIDIHDPAFKSPSKPIGPFYPDEMTAKQAARANGFAVKEDAGRGWRRVVPSPRPIDIVEKDIIIQTIQQQNIVIAAGGGGIPVVMREGRLSGIEAVIDKDFAATKLAELIDAETLLILTGVDHMAINFNQPNEQPLKYVTIAQLRSHIQDRQFPKGSMLPKVEAAIQFVEGRKGRKAVITSPGKAQAAMNGEQGTVITA